MLILYDNTLNTGEICGTSKKWQHKGDIPILTTTSCENTLFVRHYCDTTMTLQWHYSDYRDSDLDLG